MSITNRAGAARAAIPYVAASLAVLVPCYWQRRIQAGDLSSHIYNAWLTQLIRQGQAGGLGLVPQTHYVLFDMLLSGLLPVTGAAVAQRVAVSAAVLALFWGAFAYVWAASRRGRGRAPWEYAPVLAMLAYGWVYHMGLFNFCLSLGLSFAALALAERRTPWAAGGAAALLALAYTAHALPAGWALAVAGYAWAARRLRARHRVWLMAGALAGLALVCGLMKVLLRCQWSPSQAIAFSGADQIWVFGSRYLPLAGAVLLVWGLWLRNLLAAWGIRRTLCDLRFEIYALTGAGILLIPGTIVLRASGQAEDLLLARMSLAGAVLYCALAACVTMRKQWAAVMAAIAVVFFSFLYADEGALNRVEDRMDQAVTQIPPGQRVVSALMDPDMRQFALLHVIDRACLGRCFSYANYEPSVGQFRVRALRENGIVAANFRDSWAMQAGGYVVKPHDLPLYRVDLCAGDGGRLCAAPVEAGATLERTWLRVTPELWK